MFIDCLLEWTANQRFWLADLMGPLVLDRLDLDLCGASGLGADSFVSQQQYDWLREAFVGARLTSPSPHASLADGSSLQNHLALGEWFPNGLGYHLCIGSADSGDALHLRLYRH